MSARGMLGRAAGNNVLDGALVQFIAQSKRTGRITARLIEARGAYNRGDVVALGTGEFRPLMNGEELVVLRAENARLLACLEIVRDHRHLPSCAAGRAVCECTANLNLMKAVSKALTGRE